jgi:hypothetical protein
MPEPIKEALFSLLGWGSTLIVALGGVAFAWLRRRGLGAIGCSLLLLGLCFFGATAALGLWVRYRPQPASLTRQIAGGPRYHRFSRTLPRPTVNHWVSIDLSLPGLRFLVTSSPKDECVPAQKTTQFLAQTHAKLAINTHYFFSCAGAPATDAMVEGALVHPLGVAVAARQAIGTRAWGSTLYFDEQGRPSIDAPPEDVVTALSGSARLLQHGNVLPQSDPVVAPRSAIGFNLASNQLMLLVVDGRQRGYSEGLTLRELAELLLELGASDAIELDGGGSATLAVRADDGNVELLNSPIHQRIPGRERPVSSHLAIDWTDAR